jgi:hypothetical protein
MFIFGTRWSEASTGRAVSEWLVAPAGGIGSFPSTPMTWGGATAGTDRQPGPGEPFQRTKRPMVQR